ncbi:MAG: hypothetical protein KAJ07_00600 [Planctomycetes bacterium]|nr:hypothetical protein [Planctomycetota bacterium]
MTRDEEKLTEDDLGMFWYFYVDKGDITRWCDWEKKKPLFEKQYPELIRALNNIEIEEKYVGLIIEDWQ